MYKLDDLTPEQRYRAYESWCKSCPKLHMCINFNLCQFKRMIAKNLEIFEIEDEGDLE